VETYATVEGHRIFYVQDGERGLPIVLVHGVPTGSYQWSPVQRLLARYLNTYNIDLIGMGKSDKPLAGWEYTWANDAKIIAGLMDQWGYEKMIVAGDDWGGGIALTFAALYPQRTDLCVTIDPVAYESGRWRRSRRSAGCTSSPATRNCGERSPIFL
jgi:pimeloyl-ACP methyl ester carboxylesterase